MRVCRGYFDSCKFVHSELGSFKLGFDYSEVLKEMDWS